MGRLCYQQKGLLILSAIKELHIYSRSESLRCSCQNVFRPEEAPDTTLFGGEATRMCAGNLTGSSEGEVG